MEPLVKTKKLRSSRLQMFFKTGVLKNFAIFTGKHLLESLFNKEALLKRDTTCEYCEIFKNSFFNRAPPVAAFIRKYYIVLD